MGCSRQIVEADNPVAIGVDDYQAYFDASIQALRDFGYVIDRRDYRFGAITTLPQGSPNLLEVWDPQNTTAEQAAESTLSDIQRRVIVSLMPADENEASNDGAYQLDVTVLLERKQVPARRLAGSARRNVFSNLAAPPRHLRDNGVTGNYYEPMGRDEYLEARLMQLITDRVASSE